jgi:hypothetical protein
MTVAAIRNVVVKPMPSHPRGILARTFSGWQAWVLLGSSSAPEYSLDDGGVGGRGESSRTQTQSRPGLVSRRCSSRATRLQLSTLGTMHT